MTPQQLQQHIIDKGAKKKNKYLCQKEKKMCQYGGNKSYNYGFVSGTSGYCFKDKKFLDKVNVCPLTTKKPTL